ncbi:MAG: hypothetical protein IT539_07840 [Bradyrhizobiaceae bacterium]|nr:hypothetical protein [Bradyrhizobiaceae bacterium]
MLPGGPGAAEKRSGKLDKETQVKIGQQLRAMYDEVVRQGVPDRFAELLRQLEQRDDDRETQS